MPKEFNVETYCSIDRMESYEYEKKIESKYPGDTKKQLEYAEKIMPGQLYINYLINTLWNPTSKSAYPYNDGVRVDTLTFRTKDIENLLRSMGFMIERMHDGLPEHNYYYIKSKSDSFFKSLYEQVKMNIE
mgnify:CR=1 FL=1